MTGPGGPYVGRRGRRLRGAWVVFALLAGGACGTEVAFDPDGPDTPPISGPLPGERDGTGGRDGGGVPNRTGGRDDAGERGSTSATGDDEPGGGPAAGRGPNDHSFARSPGGGGSGSGGEGAASSTGNDGRTGGAGVGEPSVTPGGPPVDPSFDPTDGVVAFVPGGPPTGPPIKPPDEFRARAGRDELSRTIVVRNDGHEDVVVSDVELQGPDREAFSADATSCSGAVLAPGESCAVEVSYLPTEAGVEHATLVVAMQDGGSAEVPLEGQATP